MWVPEARRGKVCPAAHHSIFGAAPELLLPTLLLVRGKKKSLNCQAASSPPLADEVCVARCFVKAAWQKKAETLRNVTRLNLVYEIHPWADRNVLMLSPSPQSLLAASRETLVLGKARCYV